MQSIAFSAAKIGLPADANEDAFAIKTLSGKKMLVTVSDGASTGVFSRLWSQHIVNSVDAATLASETVFAANLGAIRGTFKPDISRPSAQRKFLLEGSYATLLAAFVEKTGWLFPKLNLDFYSVGDVNLLVFDTAGKLKFSHPYTAANQFNNAPDLIRSSDKLQEKTPLTIRHGSYTADGDDLIVILSDALAELIFRNLTEAFDLLKNIAACQNDADFAGLMASYNKERGMKNDDATSVCITINLGKYFKSARED